MEKVLLEAALDNGYLNTNNMVATFEGSALRLKTRAIRVRTLSNLARIQMQTDKNEELDNELKKERDTKIKKVTQKAQKEVAKLEKKSMEERLKLLDELSKKKEETRDNSIEYEQLYNTMCVPIPKCDRKIVKEYPELEEKAEKLKAQLEKLRKESAAKPKKKEETLKFIEEKKEIGIPKTSASKSRNSSVFKGSAYDIFS